MSETSDGRRQALSLLNDGLARARSVDEALSVAEAHSDRTGEGREYFNNLKAFLRSFEMPASAELTERELYVGFVRKLVHLGLASQQQLLQVEAQCEEAVVESTVKFTSGRRAS